MSDEELKQYVTKFGDRVAIKAFAMKEEEQESSSQNLVQRLRVRMTQRRLRKRSLPNIEHDLRSTMQKGNKNAERKERRIELGWLVMDDDYRQVKEPKGGGVKHLKVSSHCLVNSLLDNAKSLFFPDGIAKKGEVIEAYDFSLIDSSHKAIDEMYTVSDLYEKLKVKILRLYMVTKPKMEMQEEVSLCFILLRGHFIWISKRNTLLCFQKIRSLKFEKFDSMDNIFSHTIKDALTFVLANTDFFGPDKIRY